MHRPFLIFAVSMVLFYFILSSSLTGMEKFILSFIMFLAFGRLLEREMNLGKEMIFYLARSTIGLRLIEDIAKRYKGLFVFLADTGTVASYGLLSVFLLKHINWKSAVAGFLLMFLVASLSPFGVLYLFSALKGTNSETFTSGNQASPIIDASVLFFTGFFGEILFRMVSTSVSIFERMLSFFFSSGSPPQAGATLILPGINLPLVEGIFALLVVLVVHEGAHAVLARIGRIKVKSTGIVLFGTLPVGAFVEPDEKGIENAGRKEKIRVIAAGPTFNFIAFLVFILLFFTFTHLTSPFRIDGYMVVQGNGDIPTGAFILSAKASGKPVELFNLPKNSDVVIETSKGEIETSTNGDGKLGIKVVKTGGLVSRYSIPFLGFIHTFLGLAFSLNVVVGLINLLPIMMFDGYQLVGEIIRNGAVVKALSAVAFISLLVSFLPSLLF